MGLLDAYQEGTDKVAEVMAARPMEPEPAKPKHSAWSAIPRAVVSAGAEVVGNVSDVLDAFGQVSAAAGGLSPGFRPETQKQADQSAEAFHKLKVEGLDFRGEDSQQVYKFARDLRPDPVTAGNAENIVFGLTKGLTKAVGSAAMLGPVGGAFAFGGSEGMTTAEDLAVQGVDKATRTKVGTVTAAMNTAGVLVPVAGNTLAKTATLVAVGGPGSFIAQQAAINHILSSADYGEIAKQYDPLDPMGLIVSTLVPAGFAAYAKRGEFGATVPARGATPDDVDAAMTHNLTAMQDLRAAVDDVTGQPSPDVQGAMGDGARAAADTETQTRVMEPEQVVADVQPETTPQLDLARVPVTENENFKVWFAESKVVQKDGLPMVVYHGSTTQGLDEIRPGSREPGAWFTRSIQYANDYAKGPEGEIYELYLSIQNPMVVKFDSAGMPVVEGVGLDIDNNIDLVRYAMKKGYDGVHFPDGNFSEESEAWVAFRSEQIKSATSNSGRFDPSSGSLTDPAPFDVNAVADATAAARVEPDPARQVADPTPDAQQAGAANEAPDAVAARVKQVLDEQPDLVARVDDDGKPVKWADELEAVRREAQEGTDDALGAMDAPLLKVAAECALATGTAGI